jgi:hypothetical protein
VNTQIHANQILILNIVPDSITFDYLQRGGYSIWLRSEWKCYGQRTSNGTLFCVNRADENV